MSKEELTTAMHGELIGKDIEAKDLAVMGVRGAINRGLTKAEALAKYHLSEKFYDDNIERVLSQP